MSDRLPTSGASTTLNPEPAFTSVLDPDGDTPRGGALRLGRLRWPARIAGITLALIFLAAILAPLIAPQDPLEGALDDRLLPLFSSGHPLGTDDQGRDLLSRLLWGARLSLLAGVVPVLVAGVVGTTLGIFAGIGSRRRNTLTMRTLDVFYAFPAVLLAVAIAAALGSGISNAIIALSIVLIPPIARIAEAEVAQIRNAEFIEVARVAGASWPTIVRLHVLRNIAPTIVVYCTATIGVALVFAAGLGFLGLGISPPTAEWGSMLNGLLPYIYTNAGVALMPAVAVFITSIAFTLLGDGLRDLIDVRGDSR